MPSRRSPRCARSGFELHILSGDRGEAVEPIAQALGIDKWLAGLKPADKIAFVDTLKAQGRRVLMVGDGLNDAPALAAAHVSLSPIAAADLTQAQADAVFLGELLAPVVEAIALARRARGLMAQNLGSPRSIMQSRCRFAIAGMVTPLIAALAMSGSSMLVTLNALRARTRGAGMNVIIYLLPMALGLGLIGLFAFLWALKRAIQRRRWRRPARACRMTTSKVSRHEFFRFSKN